MSTLREIAKRVVAARKDDGSWDELKNAIGDLEDALAAPLPAIGDDGGQAFSFVEPPTSCGVAPGMTLRDWFAGQALVGELAATNTNSAASATVQAASENGRSIEEQVAANCYDLADAMLAARKEGGAK